MLWHFFLAVVFTYPTAKSSFIFPSVDLDIISFQKQEKKPRTSVSPSNMLHICALCSGSSKFS